MKTAIVKFSNGETITTSINGADEEIRRYYISNLFDCGVFPEELMCKAVSVTILPDECSTELLEAMVDIIRSLSGMIEPERVVMHLFNLRYDCKLCGGRSKPNSKVVPSCPACNGTGKGEKMLSINAQHQPPV